MPSSGVHDLEDRWDNIERVRFGGGVGRVITLILIGNQGNRAELQVFDLN